MSTTESQTLNALNQKSTPRKFAEWFTLGLSTLLIALLAGFLLWESLQPHQEYMPVQVHVLKTEVGKAGQRYVLPIEVTNRGNQTLRNLQIKVTAVSPGDKEAQEREVAIDYLGENAATRSYIYFERNPREQKVEAVPLSYQLD